MNTFRVRPLTVLLVGTLALTTHLTAQDKPPATLTAEEVQQLIIRGAPADHARLRANFEALADRYAAEAQRHATMRPAFAKNEKLAHMATSQAAHCQKLAKSNEESATILRELAKHHSRQEEGVASEPPRGSERFQGTGAVRIPSDAELTRLAATAETPADHRALESYFTGIATRYEREAKESDAYARSWRSLTKNPSAPQLAARWDALAKQQRTSASEARAAADMHKEHARTTK